MIRVFLLYAARGSPQCRSALGRDHLHRPVPAFGLPIRRYILLDPVYIKSACIHAMSLQTSLLQNDQNLGLGLGDFRRNKQAEAARLHDPIPETASLIER